jgi:hypothetical protein
MHAIHREEIKMLARERKPPCVSIYMPAHKISSEQDRIRLKNLLDSAETELTQSGLRLERAQRMLSSARGLLGDPDFWQHQEDGLALLLNHGEQHILRLPVPFKEQVVIGSRFHLKPLFQAYSGERVFFVLALSKARARLLRATEEFISEVKLDPDTPRSLEEALKYDEFENHLQFHQTAAGKNAAMYHGQGTNEQYPKDQVARFFKMLDRGVHGALKDSRAPLVLAGVDYLFPIYRDANSYAGLVPEHLTGNFDHVRDEELHLKALELLRPRFEEEKRAAIRHVADNLESPIGSRNLKEIVPAAHFARVETLVVAEGEETWGKLNLEDGVVSCHRERMAGDEELIESAAIQTIAHGGRVIALPKEEIPGGESVAAVFRF